MTEGVALQPGSQQVIAPASLAGEPTGGQLPGAQTPPVDWEARFKGLQPLFQAEQQKRIALETQTGQHAQTIEQLRQQIGTFETNTATTTETLAERDSRIQELESSNAVKDAENQKYRLINSEFPNLVGFSEHIPTIADEAEQKGALQEWLELVTKEIDVQVKAQVGDAVRAAYPAVSPARGADAIPKMEEVLAGLEETAGDPLRQKEYQQFLQWRDQLETKGN